MPTWFRHEVPAPGIHRAAPGTDGADHAGRAQTFGAELAEFSGEAEHVHLLVNFPPTVAISRLVNSPKRHVLP
jgi:hypothetical protein